MLETYHGGGGGWLGQTITLGLVGRSSVGLGKSFVAEGAPCRRRWQPQMSFPS